MPIYEFACPKCRKIFNFLSRRINPDRLPVCPKCGNPKLVKQLSPFAAIRGGKQQTGANDDSESPHAGPDFEDPRVMRAMGELERDMEHIDENNPRHIARMMRKMKDLMPANALPKDIDVAIKRLEAGEDPAKIEQDMGDVFGELSGSDDEGSGGSGAGYSRDGGLYDY
jgi:putative FmdB family regulatory protein